MGFPGLDDLPKMEQPRPFNRRYDMPPQLNEEDLVEHEELSAKAVHIIKPRENQHQLAGQH